MTNASRIQTLGPDAKSARTTPATSSACRAQSLAAIPGENDVCTEPGSTTLTFTPVLRTSRPTASVKPITPNLDAEYAAHRQRFLAEQGYGYIIRDADDLLGPAI